MLMAAMSSEFPTFIGHSYSATMTQAGAIYTIPAIRRAAASCAVSFASPRILRHKRRHRQAHTRPGHLHQSLAFRCHLGTCAVLRIHPEVARLPRGEVVLHLLLDAKGRIAGNPAPLLIRQAEPALLQQGRQLHRYLDTVQGFHRQQIQG